MNPECNKVGSYVSLNPKLLGPIGYKEEAKAKSFVGVLLESAGRKSNCEVIEPVTGTN